MVWFRIHLKSLKTVQRLQSKDGANVEMETFTVDGS